MRRMDRESTPLLHTAQPHTQSHGSAVAAPATLSTPVRCLLALAAALLVCVGVLMLARSTARAHSFRALSTQLHSGGGGSSVARAAKEARMAQADPTSAFVLESLRPKKGDPEPSNPYLYLPPAPTTFPLHTRLVARTADHHASSSRPSSSPRLLVVGDLHGCMSELDSLVSLAGLDVSQGDRVVSTGDLVTKGPESRRIVQYLRRGGHYAVLGNHDQLLLKNALLLGLLDGRSYGSDGDIKQWSEAEVDAAGGPKNETYARTYYARMNGFSVKARPDSKHAEAAKELGKEDLEWLASLPLTIDLSEAFPNHSAAGKHHDSHGSAATAVAFSSSSSSASSSSSSSAAPLRPWTVVHAGLVPGVPLHSQHPYHVSNMRNWDSQTRAPSATFLEGDAWTLARAPDLPPILFGHDAARGFQHPSGGRVGLDTGACNGKYLTGLLLPEGRLLHVRSAAVYSEPKGKPDVARAPPMPSGVTLEGVERVEPANAHSADMRQDGEEAKKKPTSHL